MDEHFVCILRRATTRRSVVVAERQRRPHRRLFRVRTHRCRRRAAAAASRHGRERTQKTQRQHFETIPPSDTTKTTTSLRCVVHRNTHRLVIEFIIISISLASSSSFSSSAAATRTTPASRKREREREREDVLGKRDGLRSSLRQKAQKFEAKKKTIGERERKREERLLCSKMQCLGYYINPKYFFL